MPHKRRLLSVAHSYVVALNRRLAYEIARAGADSWDVTVVAPTYFHGGHDLRPITLEPGNGDPYQLVPVPAYCTSEVHCFVYGWSLRRLLAERWDMVHAWEEPFVLAGGQLAWWTR